MVVEAPQHVQGLVVEEGLKELGGLTQHLRQQLVDPGVVGMASSSKSRSKSKSSQKLFDSYSRNSLHLHRAPCHCAQLHVWGSEQLEHTLNIHHIFHLSCLLMCPTRIPASLNPQGSQCITLCECTVLVLLAPPLPHPLQHPT